MNLSARQFLARVNAATKAFKAAGGQHPCVRIKGDEIEIRERPPNLADDDKSARNQSRIDEHLGGPARE